MDDTTSLSDLSFLNFPTTPVKKKHSMEQRSTHAHLRGTRRDDQFQGIDLRLSLNQLREKLRSEKSKESLMTNRLNYCEVGRDRLNQQAAIAKWRYQRMIQSRRKSFQENNWLQKERENLEEKKLKQAKLVVSRVKSQKQRSVVSLAKWQSSNRNKASEVRTYKKDNQSLREAKSREQLQKNKHVICKIKSEIAEGRSRIQSAKVVIIEQGRRQHTEKLFQHYQQTEFLKRKNTKLLDRFKKRMKVLEEQKVKKGKELQQYQRHLEDFGRRDRRRRHNFEINSFVTAVS